MSRLTIYIGVVDDDESYCRSLSRLLRAVDYTPVTYSSAEEFFADTKQPRFDCLLLDVELKGISGIELKRRLAAVGSTTPVIYVTAHDDPVTRRNAIAGGCAAFVSKVEPGEELLNAIAAVLQVPPERAH
jgi:FixJ family two-component response regulator